MRMMRIEVLKRSLVFIPGFFFLALSSLISPLATAQAQDVAFDHWVWAGQSMAEVEKSQDKVLISCEELSIRCQPTNLRVLVRSWGGKLGQDSITHQSPRYFSKDSKLILSFRLEQLINPRKIAAIIQRDVNIWRRAERQVIGVEVDFDSPSKKLKIYRRWLMDLQKSLQGDITLGITGLPTWFEDNKEQATELASVVKEVSLMFYRQKQTPITEHLLTALNQVDNIRYAFLCNDDRWKALYREIKHDGSFRMAIFITSDCNDIGEPAPS